MVRPWDRKSSGKCLRSLDIFIHGHPMLALDTMRLRAAARSFGPTNRNLLERVKGDVGKLQAESPNAPIPVDLVTASGSGLDPEISPAAAEFQIPRVARERGMKEDEVRALVQKHRKDRDLGSLGEPRGNVLHLNLS